jgi:hypothetical protein
MTRHARLRLEGLAPQRTSSRATATVPLRSASLQACRRIAARRPYRGLTLMELLMAVIITAMVGAGIAGMLGAVSSGVGTRRDNREIMVRAHAAQCRLAAYLATSRCVLAKSATNVTIWLADSRQSNTVHATEIRWLRFDSAVGEFLVEYVEFPAAWTQTACELADLEYASGSNWETVRTFYGNKGLLASRALVDGVQGVAVDMDHNAAMSARHLTFDFEFAGENAAVVVQVSGSIQNHEAPLK